MTPMVPNGVEPIVKPSLLKPLQGFIIHNHTIIPWTFFNRLIPDIIVRAVPQIARAKTGFLLPIRGGRGCDLGGGYGAMVGRHCWVQYTNWFIACYISGAYAGIRFMFMFNDLDCIEPLHLKLTAPGIVLVQYLLTCFVSHLFNTPAIS